MAGRRVQLAAYDEAVRLTVLVVAHEADVRWYVGVACIVPGTT